MEFFVVSQIRWSDVNDKVQDPDRWERYHLKKDQPVDFRFVVRVDDAGIF